MLIGKRVLMNNPEWHRVSIISVIHFFISRTLRIIKELGFNAGPILLAGYVAVDDRSFWFSIFGLVIFALLLVDTLITYFTFRFQVTDNQIIVKQGFFTREVLDLKFDRIQNVNISVPWYFKPFKLVNCMLDSAGSSAKEASIPGITETFAQNINQQIHAYHQQHNISDILATEPVTEPGQGATSVMKLANKEVTKYGFTNSMIFVMAAASFPIVEKTIGRLGWDFSAHLNELASYLPLPELAARITLVVSSLFLFGFLLLCLTALGAFIRFYNYELHNQPNKLKRIAGLLDRQQISVRKQKIQGISIKQNIFAKILRRVTVHFHQTQSEHNPQSKKQCLIIPMLKPDQWQQYIPWVYSNFSVEDINFANISRHYLFRKSLILLIVLFVLVIIFHAVSQSTNSFYILAIIPVGIFCLWLKYRRYGYYMNADFCIIRSGFIGVNYTLIPLYKIQKVIEKQSFFQRRKQLCSIDIQLAFKKLKLPYLPQAVANNILNICLYKVESTDKNWL